MAVTILGVDVSHYQATLAVLADRPVLAAVPVKTLTKALTEGRVPCRVDLPPRQEGTPQVWQDAWTPDRVEAGLRTLSGFWATAKAAGVAFGVAKASQGTSFTDPMFAGNITQMRALGILPGAYHFLVGGISGAAQADYFAGVLAKVGGPAGLQCVADVESTGVTIGIVRDFAARFKARFPGHLIEVYTGRWFWRDRPEIGNADGTGIGPLWTASYPASRGTGTPAQQWAHIGSTAGFAANYGGWGQAALWQYSDNARIGSVTCDADAYLGTLDQLRALTSATPGDDMSAADVAAINAHTDAVMGNFFASLSHGTRTDGKTPNGVGMDQVVAGIAAVKATLAALVAADPANPLDEATMQRLLDEAVAKGLENASLTIHTGPAPAPPA